MYTHNLEPILFSFGFFEIRWYSLAYVFGILIGWWLGKKIIIKRLESENLDLDPNEFDNLITYIIISLIVGGRLGYAVFYNPTYYFLNPIEIVKVWEGGMSFHGALIGIILGTFLFSINKKISALFFLDIIAYVAPIGIFFGRIANFINGELVGKTTSVFWGVIFPNFGNLPRHPSQLYEAFLEGIILFIIMNLVMFKKGYKTGTCSCVFLIFYGIFRIISEFFREPDIQIGYLFNILSMGTVLSIVMILIGIIISIKKNGI